jgi:phosphoribosylformylglycinamidine synthase
LRDVLGREEGAPPPVDLEREKLHGDFVRRLINNGCVTSVHDVSDGGLAIAVAEMALASGLGAKLDAMDHAALFGEDQARYVITANNAEAAKIIADAKVPMVQIGEVVNDATVTFGSTEIKLAEIQTAHEDWFPKYMAGGT